MPFLAPVLCLYRENQKSELDDKLESNSINKIRDKLEKKFRMSVFKWIKLFKIITECLNKRSHQAAAKSSDVIWKEAKPESSRKGKNRIDLDADTKKLNYFMKVYHFLNAPIVKFAYDKVLSLDFTQNIFYHSFFCLVVG